VIPFALGKSLSFGPLADRADGETSTLEEGGDTLEGIFIEGYGEDRLFFFHR
jgi:hypothetical protein